MKKFLKGIAALTLALTISTGVVNASSTKKIDTNTCETVYTNYYFFLDANTSDYFNTAPLTSFQHNTVAEYLNNSYQIANFNATNVGYGQVAVSPSTTTSADGITSMSLDDFYSLMQHANNTNGAFSNGTKNYIVSHNWYKVNSDNSETLQTDSLSTASATVAQLKAATLNSYSNLTLQTSINPSNPNPFKIRIDRSYYGYLTGMPVTINGLDWYFHPALFYVQYCSTKTNTEPTIEYYNVYYRSRTTDVVTNMPADSKHDTRYDMNISSNTPYREGYTFLGWTTDISSPVADPNFAPNSKYTDRKDLTLYAVWQKNESPAPVIPDNPQTGIDEYLIPFGGVAGFSGLALTVLKKKKGFKQF